MTRLPALLMVLVVLGCSTANTTAANDATLATGPVAGPNPTLTPGVVDIALTAQYLCTHPTGLRRTATAADKAAVYSAYHIAAKDKHSYVLDDLIPLELGGVNVRANLWPQPTAQAHLKDGTENRLHREMCAGTVTLTAAQAQMRSYGH